MELDVPPKCGARLLTRAVVTHLPLPAQLEISHTVREALAAVVRVMAAAVKRRRRKRWRDDDVASNIASKRRRRMPALTIEAVVRGTYAAPARARVGVDTVLATRRARACSVLRSALVVGVAREARVRAQCTRSLVWKPTRHYADVFRGDRFTFFDVVLVREEMARLAAARRGEKVDDAIRFRAPLFAGAPTKEGFENAPPPPVTAACKTVWEGTEEMVAARAAKTVWEGTAKMDVDGSTRLKEQPPCLLEIRAAAADALMKRTESGIV